jgi:hypothetical protein
MYDVGNTRYRRKVHVRMSLTAGYAVGDVQRLVNQVAGAVSSSRLGDAASSHAQICVKSERTKADKSPSLCTRMYMYVSYIVCAGAQGQFISDASTSEPLDMAGITTSTKRKDGSLSNGSLSNGNPRQSERMCDFTPQSCKDGPCRRKILRPPPQRAPVFQGRAMLSLQLSSESSSNILLQITARTA